MFLIFYIYIKTEKMIKRKNDTIHTHNTDFDTLQEIIGMKSTNVNHFHVLRKQMGDPENILHDPDELSRYLDISYG